MRPISTGLSRQAVDILFFASGASAIQQHVPIQRFQRDIQGARQPRHHARPDRNRDLRTSALRPRTAHADRLTESSDSDGRKHAGGVRRRSRGSGVLGRRPQRCPVPRRQPHGRHHQSRLVRQRRHRRAGRHGRHQRRRRHGVRERARPVVPVAGDAACFEPGGHARNVGRTRGKSGRRRSRGRTAFPEAKLHESVDGEWSFVQTLRHLVFAMDKWFTSPILGRAFDPIGLPNSGSVDFPWPGLDDELSPSVTEALAVRADRGDALPRLPRLGCDRRFRTTGRGARERHEPCAGMHLHRLRGGVLAQPLRQARPGAARHGPVTGARGGNADPSAHTSSPCKRNVS